METIELEFTTIEKKRLAELLQIEREHTQRPAAPAAGQARPVRWTPEEITQARLRGQLAALVDIDTFISALDAIEQLRARAERAEEQAEECAAQFRRLWGAIVKVHKILFSARTCGKGKYGGKYHLAALDAENLLFDVMEGGEA